VRAPKALWNRGGEGQDQMAVESSEVAVTE
jgi:hypothetical protein